MDDETRAILAALCDTMSYVLLILPRDEAAPERRLKLIRLFEALVIKLREREGDG